MSSADVHGQIEAVCLDSRETVFVRITKIAALVSLAPDGPTRLVFDAGGHLDICGSARYWRQKIRVVELGEG